MVIEPNGSKLIILEKKKRFIHDNNPVKMYFGISRVQFLPMFLIYVYRRNLKTQYIPWLQEKLQLTHVLLTMQ